MSRETVYQDQDDFTLKVESMARTGAVRLTAGSSGDTEDDTRDVVFDLALDDVTDFVIDVLRARDEALS